MRILNDKQIKQKVRRLAYEIIEQNSGQKKLFLGGINNNGYAFAKILIRAINQISHPKPDIELFRISLNPAEPMSSEITFDIEESRLKSSCVIVVDDVANTGRTLFYAFKPFMKLLVQKIQVAVLVDRKHKSFPIHVNYVGLSLATTIKNHIDVDLTEDQSWFAEIV